MIGRDAEILWDACHEVNDGGVTCPPGRAPARAARTACYRMNMRKAISITLSEDNLLCLRGQAAQTRKRSVSELLDRIVGEARNSGWADAGSVRTVAGTIDISEDDPGLETADAYVRTLFTASTRRPLLVRESSAPGPRRRKAAARG